jgi:hypothetical protein
MELMDLYNEYRRIEVNLINEKIFKLLDRDIILQAAKILDMTDENDNVVFTSESHLGVLMDFVLHEWEIDGESMIQRYIRNNKPENETEKKLLEAHASSYTSFFRMVNIARDKHMVILKDIFNQDRNIKIIDESLSDTANMDILVFARILKLPELNMATGASLIFLSDKEFTLLDTYKNIMKDITESREANKFIIFYALLKEYGITLIYHNVIHDSAFSSEN